MLWRFSESVLYGRRVRSSKPFVLGRLTGIVFPGTLFVNPDLVYSSDLTEESSEVLKMGGVCPKGPSNRIGTAASGTSSHHGSPLPSHSLSRPQPHQTLKVCEEEDPEGQRDGQVNCRPSSLCRCSGPSGGGVPRSPEDWGTTGEDFASRGPAKSG